MEKMDKEVKEAVKELLEKSFLFPARRGEALMQYYISYFI